MSQSFEATLVRFCAPTLAGIKPGGLFQFKDAEARLRRKAELWDEQLQGLGVRVRLMRYAPRQGSGLVYVYRPTALARRLSGTGTRAMLAELGYDITQPESMLDTLERRLRPAGDFPHEIGLFLGYPLADVVGFMEHRGQNCTYCGCWKSYSDPKSAAFYSDLCRQRTQELCRSYASGVPLVRLAA